MRDTLIHDYVNMEIEIIWQAARQDAAELKIMITQIPQEPGDHA
jgi:uncharacterized protein with HEPN domain